VSLTTTHSLHLSSEGRLTHPHPLEFYLIFPAHATTPILSIPGSPFQQAMLDWPLISPVPYPSQLPDSSDIYRQSVHYLRRLQPHLPLTAQVGTWLAGQSHLSSLPPEKITELLAEMYPVYSSMGLLSFTPTCRAFAQLFWEYALCNRLVSPKTSPHQRANLQTWVAAFVQDPPFSAFPYLSDRILDYLLAELQSQPPKFITTTVAWQTAQTCRQVLESQPLQWAQFKRDWRYYREQSLAQQYEYIKELVSNTVSIPQSWLPEVVAILLTKRLSRQVVTADTTITGLGGLPDCYFNAQLPAGRIDLPELLFQVDQHTAFLDYQRQCYNYLKRLQNDWKINGFELSSSQITSRPIKPSRWAQQVHLPKLRTNLYQQVYSEHPQALLLLSPTGYGKTTVVQHLAKELNWILVSIDCRQVAAQTDSLDPQQAPDRETQRQLVALDWALAIQEPVLLLLDNIQAVPEGFMRLFRELVSPNRRLDGTWQGQFREYCFQGKRWGLILAGTSAEQLPEDMRQQLQIYSYTLAIRSHLDLFALSYLENALMVNPWLFSLLDQDITIFDQLLQMAQGQLRPEQMGLESEEYRQAVQVLEKLGWMQKWILPIVTCQLQANPELPEIKLSGNYRFFNQLAAQVTPEMSLTELGTLLDEGCWGQLEQLPKAEREQNELFWKELRGELSLQELQRWQQIQQRWRGQGLTGIEALTEAVYSLERRVGEWMGQLSELHLEMQVVNQLPMGVEQGLLQAIELIEKTLLPVVQDYERKSKLDLLIFERVREMGEVLKALHNKLEHADKLVKQYKPLSFKD